MYLTDLTLYYGGERLHPTPSIREQVPEIQEGHIVLGHQVAQVTRCQVTQIILEETQNQRTRRVLLEPMVLVVVPILWALTRPWTKQQVVKVVIMVDRHQQKAIAFQRFAC